jgi:hypothetical protein
MNRCSAATPGQQSLVTRYSRLTFLAAVVAIQFAACQMRGT